MVVDLGPFVIRHDIIWNIPINPAPAPSETLPRPCAQVKATRLDVASSVCSLKQEVVGLILGLVSVAGHAIAVLDHRYGLHPLSFLFYRPGFRSFSRPRRLLNRT